LKLIEYFYHHLPASENFITRKCAMSSEPFINLYGVRGAGKTSIVLDYLNDTMVRDEILYIDFENPNFILNTLNLNELQKYINQHQIKILVLDHYDFNLLPHFPTVTQLIVISRIALNYNHFSYSELFPLDYEEFLAFEKVHQQNKSFNHFLRLGTLPISVRYQKSYSHIMKTFFHVNFDLQEQKLLVLLAYYHTTHLTINQIYLYAKASFKISKDYLYQKIKLFKEEKLLIFIEDRYQKSGKKMLLFDFAFAKYLTLGQPFIIQFDTMVALALIKHHINIETFGIHGYITTNNILIIPAPFESEESLWLKSQKKFNLYKKHHIQKVIIVTVANHYDYFIEKLYFEALPFNEWSVINEEDTI